MKNACVVALLTAVCLLVLTAPPTSAQTALRFDGIDDYVSFGQAPGLGVTQFTLEVWFYREGPGSPVMTGSGGINAVPLLTKGRYEADGSNLDMNFFLGIVGNILGADFEEGAGGVTPGLNHPITGGTTLLDQTWYHAAATFDGTTFRLYLNGDLEQELTVGPGRLPQSNSIQHAGLATAMNSMGVAAGFFKGMLDEARVWNYARSQEEIRSTLNLPITSPLPGLVARWGLDEGTGIIIYDSSGNAIAGTILHTLSPWTYGATNPLVFHQFHFLLDGVSTMNSDWGAADLTFVGSANVLYFNLLANGSWQVQNVAVAGVQGLGIPQTQRFWFDLGNEVGQDVLSVDFGYALTPDPLVVPPSGGLTSPVGDLAYQVNSGAADAEIRGVPVAAGPMIGGRVVGSPAVRAKLFPNQQAGDGECVPTAVSNSLQYLNSWFNLGLPDEELTIAKMKLACNWGMKQCPHGLLPRCWDDNDPNRPEGERNAWWQDKKRYMEVNNLPITTRMIPAANIAQVLPEYQADQDIEIDLHGHMAMVTDIRSQGSGTYEVTVVHDTDQSDSTGGTVWETAIWDSTTAKWYGPLASYGLGYFVVECPLKPSAKTQYSTTNPGAVRPSAGDWLAAEPALVLFPDTLDGRIWIGKNNRFVLANEKQWTVELIGEACDKYGPSAVDGYRSFIPPMHVGFAQTTGIKHFDGPPKKRVMSFLLRPQPDWEKLELIRIVPMIPGEITYLQVKSYSHCTRVNASGQNLRLENSWFGVLGDSLQVNELFIFPETSPIDGQRPNALTVPPESGTWSSEIVYTDPEGGARPHGGVHWWTAGPGLEAEQPYELSIFMTGMADSAYSYFAFNAQAESYQYFKIVTGSVVGSPETPMDLRHFSIASYPNPFHPATTITYTLAKTVKVKLEVFDLQGRRVRALVDEEKAAGRYEISWDGTDQNGKALASGVYFCRMSAGTFEETRRLTLVR